MANKFIRRSDRKVLSGVCAGIGDYFNVDANLVRAAFVFVGLITGLWPVLLVYFLAWVGMPDVASGRAGMDTLKEQYEDKLKPAYDEKVKPTVDEKVKPFYDEKIKPTVDEKVKPFYDEKIKPTVDDKIKPTFEQRPSGEPGPAPETPLHSEGEHTENAADWEQPYPDTDHGTDDPFGAQPKE